LRGVRGAGRRVARWVLRRDGEGRRHQAKLTAREAAAQDASLERLLTHARAKGGNLEDQPGADQDFAHLHVEKPGEWESLRDTGKDKAAPVGADAEVVENSHRPGRELMSDSQYSSAKVQRRGGREARRMKSDDLVQEQNFGMQGKVGFEECLDTERRKEGEDELNFLPAQRANPGPRTAIMARKDDGLEAPSFTGLREHERRLVVKEIDQPCNQPSIHLAKSYEECVYPLKDKIPGFEDPRTEYPSEPTDLGFDARQNKKKGKEALKLEMPAVPEQYMAFGQEGASQRLMPGVVTLEKPGVADKGKGKGEWSDDEDEPRAPVDAKDMMSTAPDVIQMKFDVAFVDDEARQAFAVKQAAKLAQLLQLPEDYVSVRSAMPGSPMTVVAFEIIAGAAARSAGARAPGHGMARTNRPFDSPVLEVGVVSVVDQHADAIQGLMVQIVGNQVPVQRIKGGKAVAGVLGGAHAKNVKFGEEEAAGPTPAYQRSREELEAQAEKRFSGPTMSDKEAVDNDSSVTVKRPMQEYALKDDKPIVAYDRRLPKNARSKQHLLSRIHTIESTLQRLYGKLDADTELPEVEDIEKIMAATIKQTTHEPDQGAAEDMLKKPAALQPPPEESFPEKKPAREGDDDGMEAVGVEARVVTDAERREQLRAERRKRMAAREAKRAAGDGQVCVQGTAGRRVFADRV
jgi:hypothetical protein